MRSLVIAAAVMAAAMLALSPAQAQMGGGGRHHQGGNDSKSDKKPKVDEKAYKAAPERLPQPKEKYDPWRVARPAPPDSKKIK